MNCPDCDKAIHGDVCSCGWAKPGATKVIYRNTEGPRAADGITREQFGLTLFSAIHMIGEIKQLRILLGRVAMGELPTRDYKEREGKLIDQLRTALLTLKADDVSALLGRYPWVAAL